MGERLETWVHQASEPDIDRLEARMEPVQAEEIYELDRCIECGCCIAACGTARMRSTRSRFRLDPRDERSDEDGCMTLLGCNDVCPKELPLQTQLAFMRRKMARVR